MDVLSASWLDEKIAWYENDGAADPSFTEGVISTSAASPCSVSAADVDGDGDMDVLSASWHEIAWYENDGAADPAFTERVISTTAEGPCSVYAADVDGDGDMDIVSASYDDNKIAWYENDGAADPTFAERVISTTAYAAWSVYAADVDGDGDMDGLSASTDDNKIAWYENPLMVVVPFGPHVCTGEYLNFKTSTGPGDMWELDWNESGGSIDQDSGIYHAGDWPGRDVVEVSLAGGFATTVVTVQLTPRPYGVVGPGTSMDIDGGGLEIGDLHFILGCLAGTESPTSQQRLAADFDCDGLIGLADVINALRVLVGLPPVCE
jgi:hypothetical protein